MQSGDGHITLDGAMIDMGVMAGVRTGGEGTVILSARGTTISMDEAAFVETDGGAIRFESAGPILLGTVDARDATSRADDSLTTQGDWGSISLNSESGFIRAAGPQSEIFANELRLQARGDLGDAINPFAIEAATLAADGHALFIDDASSLTIDGVASVTTFRVLDDATVEDYGDFATQSDLVTHGDGAMIVTAHGLLDVHVGSDDDESGIHSEQGNIRLEATGAEGDIHLDGNLQTPGGALSILAQRDITIEEGSILANFGQGIDLVALHGRMITGEDVVIRTDGTGDIRIQSAGDLFFNGTMNAGYRAIALDVTQGSITLESPGDHPAIRAAGLALQAANTITLNGDVAPVAISTLAVRAGQDATLHVSSPAVTVGEVAVANNRVNRDGSIQRINTNPDGIFAGGTLTYLGSGDLTAHSGGIHAGGAMTIQTPGNLVLETNVTAGAATIVDVGGHMTSGLASITVGGPLQMEAQGNIVLRDDVTATQQMTIQSQGRFEMIQGDLKSGKTLQMTTAGATQIQGDVSSGWETTITAGGQVTLMGDAVSGLDFTVDSQAGITLAPGTVHAGIDVRLTARDAIRIQGGITAGRDAIVETAREIAWSGDVTGGRDVHMNATTGIGLTRATVDAGVHVTLLTEAGAVHIDGEVKAGQDATITAKDEILWDGTLKSGRETVIDSGKNIQLTHGMVDAGASLVIHAAGAVALEGDMTSDQNIAMTAGGDITLVGAVASGLDVTMDSRKGITFTQGTADAGSNVKLTAEGAIQVTGGVTAGQDATVTSVGDILWDGQVKGGREIAMDSKAGLRLTHGRVDAGASVWIHAVESLSVDGMVTAGRDTTIGAGGEVVLTGDVRSGQNVMVDSMAGMTLAPAKMDAGMDLRLTAGGPLKVTGDVHAGRDSRITAGGEVVLAGTVRSGQNVMVDSMAGITLSSAQMDAGVDLRLTAAGPLTVTGDVHAGRDSRITAGKDVVWQGNLTGGREVWVDSKGSIQFIPGTIGAGTSARLTAVNAVSVQGNIQAGHDTVVIAGGAIALVGGIHSGLDVVMDSKAHIRVSQGNFTAGKDLHLAALGSVSLAGLLTTSYETAILSGGEMFLDGTVTSGWGVEMNSRGGITFAPGSVKAGTDVRLTAAGTMQLTGNLDSGQSTVMEAGGGINLAGDWKSGTFTNLKTLGRFALASGTLATGQSLTVTSTGDIDLAGDVTSGSDIIMTGHGGWMLVGGTLNGDTMVDLIIDNAVVVDGHLKSGTDTRITTHNDLTMTNHAAFVGQRSVQMTVDGNVDLLGQVTVGDNLTINALGRLLIDGGNLEIGQQGLFDMQGEIQSKGNIHAGQDLSMTTRKGFRLESGQEIRTEANMTLMVQGGSFLDGTIIVGNQMTWTSGHSILLAGELRAGSLADLVAGGSILDNGHGSMDITAPTLRLKAGQAVGSSAILDLYDFSVAGFRGSQALFDLALSYGVDALEVAANNLYVEAGSGGIAVDNAGSLMVSGLSTTGNGHILVTARNGGMVVQNAIATQSGDILLEARNGGGTKLIFNARVTSNTGDIILSSPLLENLDRIATQGRRLPPINSPIIRESVTLGGSTLTGANLANNAGDNALLSNLYNGPSRQGASSASGSASGLFNAGSGITVNRGLGANTPTTPTQPLQQSAQQQLVSVINGFNRTQPNSGDRPGQQNTPTGPTQTTQTTTVSGTDTPRSPTAQNNNAPTGQTTEVPGNTPAGQRQRNVDTQQITRAVESLLDNMQTARERSGTAVPGQPNGPANDRPAAITTLPGLNLGSQAAQKVVDALAKISAPQRSLIASVVTQLITQHVTGNPTLDMETLYSDYQAKAVQAQAEPMSVQEFSQVVTEVQQAVAGDAQGEQ
ncbi:MAG TPA: hypothetical protein DCS88_03615 [Alphaproteobacteria bacterium]|nr:hypothetical protein [Alphaproteobacteria bacterium]